MDDNELVPSSFALSIWFDIYSRVRLVFVKLLPFVLVAIFNTVIDCVSGNEEMMATHDNLESTSTLLN